MVRYNNILRAIEYDVNRGKGTSKAERLGNTGVWKSLGDGNAHSSMVEYDDGTTAFFNDSNELVHIKTPQGNGIDLIGKDKMFHNERVDCVKDMFKDQRRRLRGQISKEDYVFFKHYNDVLCSNAFEMILNVAEIDGWSETDKRESIEMFANGKENYDFLVNGRQRYNDMVSDFDLNGYGNFYTVDIKTERREMGETNWATIDKGNRFYTNPWTNCASLIYTEPFYCDGKAPHPFADEDNVHWTEVTIYEDGNRANRGLVSWSNDEAYVKTGIGQEFKRGIIDEEHHIIFQYPYVSLRGKDKTKE